MAILRMKLSLYPRRGPLNESAVTWLWETILLKYTSDQNDVLKYYWAIVANPNGNGIGRTFNLFL